jgi:hypothetical protein
MTFLLKTDPDESLLLTVLENPLSSLSIPEKWQKG